MRDNVSSCIVGILTGISCMFIACIMFGPWNCDPKPEPEKQGSSWQSRYILSFKTGLTAEQVGIIVDETAACVRVSGIDEEMILALISLESGFNPLAQSRRGALGLFQVMPFWYDATLDVRRNMRAGCRKLIHYLQKENGLFYKAMIDFSGGDKKFPRRVYEQYRKISAGKITGDWKER